MRHASCLLLLLLLTTPAFAAASIREVRAARAGQVPIIDGRIEAAVWSQAPEISGLRQQRPDNGEAASESTQVWILYDEAALYVAARLHDRAPVTRLLGRRDTFLESDWFGVLLDPQHDRRSGNAFFVNPEGVQYDEVISNDTEEDTSWDGVWQSAVSVDSSGWSAELRIPFSQVRFPERASQEWGINFIRWFKRRQEQARLVSHPRTEHGFASRFGDLAGLDGVQPRPKVELTPYFTSGVLSSRTVSAADPLNDRVDGELNGGLDLRWTSRSNHTVSATENPHFGQVEVDPAILNLSQFEQFFPEKRLFFLEGAKLFAVGGLTTVYHPSNRLTHPILFYSRRIGRVPQGNARLSADWVDQPDETTIRGAAKLVHGTGGGTSIALLDALTDAEHARLARGVGPVEDRVVEPLTNHFAGRWTHNVGDQWRIGSLLTAVHRRNDDDTRLLPSRALVAGLDGYGWIGGRDVLVDALLARSAVSGSREAIGLLQRSPTHQFQRPDATHLRLIPTLEGLSGWGGKLSISRERGSWRYQVQGESYSEGFDPNDLGFLPRADVAAAHGMLTYLDLTQRRNTRSNRVSLGRYLTWTQGGERIGDAIAGDAATTFRSYWSASLQGAYAFAALDDREARGGPVIRRPSGWTGQLRLASDPRKPLFVDLSQALGSDDEGGRQRITKATITVRPRANISASVVTTLTSNVIGAKWIATVADTTATATAGARYVFGRLADRRLEIAPRLDWTIRTNLTVQLYLQPLAASGSYTALAELLSPGGGYRAFGLVGSTITRTSAPREYRIDPDGAGPAAPFTIRDPDFSLRSLRGSGVVRWELNGATTLFLVWNQIRSRRDFVSGRDRLEEILDLGRVPADDRFLLKVSHRFDLPR
jgi:hypothetical protein